MLGGRSVAGRWPVTPAHHGKRFELQMHFLLWLAASQSPVAGGGMVVMAGGGERPLVAGEWPLAKKKNNSLRAKNFPRRKK